MSEKLDLRDAIRSVLLSWRSVRLAVDVCPTGLTVSTVWAADLEQYETAVCDAHSAYPVERYGTVEDAMAGHGRWVRMACSGELREVEDVGIYWCPGSRRRVRLVPMAVS